MIRLTTLQGDCGHTAPVLLPGDPAAAAAAMQTATVEHLTACPAASVVDIRIPEAQS